jgi:isopenicillin-N N-acyltransferase-like protein
MLDPVELPLLDVSGRARERGRAHGEALREAVAEGLELAREAGSRPAAPGSASAHLGAAERGTPAVLDELRGIAEGAGVPFDSILEHNLADERRVFASAGRAAASG